MTTEPRRLGKYELQKRLARGGQGEVWKAFDPQLRRYVAIKQLLANLQTDPDFISRFEREAQFIASLHHPNIVQIHDFQFVLSPDSNMTTAYMVMDYIEGPTLAEYIRNTSRKRLFPEATDIIHIFTGVSLALDYAHEKGMIHRDIKPANIILDQRSTSGRTIGEPILTDFGIAKLQGGSGDTTRALGTPLYISPEQAQGLQGDKRSDLYSLGIILYEITTGVTPFRGDSMMAILMQHYHELPTSPALINPNIPPLLSEVILKSIAKDPNARFQSASAMTIALAQALNVPVPTELRRNTSASHGVNNVASPNSMPFIQVTGTPLPLTPSPAQSLFPAAPPVSTPSANGSSAAPLAPTHPASAVGSAAPLSIGGPVSLMPQTASAPSAPPVVAHSPSKKGKRWYIAFAALLIAIVIGAGLLYTLSMSKPTPPATTNSALGQVLFLSGPNAPPGSLNEVQVVLQGIPDAPADRQYYAWLETHNDSTPPVHWLLAVQHGRVSSPYQDQQHSNLLANDPDPSKEPYLFLITLQSPNLTGLSLEANDRIYYANIPRAKASDGFSVVDHLNHLLTNDPNLDKLGLNGGLNYWLGKNTQALSTEATGVKDAWQHQDRIGVRQHLVNMIYYLEGTACAPADLSKVSGATSIQPGTAIAHDTSASLLQCSQNTILSSIPAHIQTHMLGVIHAPEATRGQVKLTLKIQPELAQWQALLGQLHQQVLKLLSLPAPQLFQPSQQTLVNTLVTQASAAYNGSSSQPGVLQISTDIQHLATFDILLCPQNSSNNVCMS